MITLVAESFFQLLDSLSDSSDSELSLRLSNFGKKFTVTRVIVRATSCRRNWVFPCKKH